MSVVSSSGSQLAVDSDLSPAWNSEDTEDGRLQNDLEVNTIPAKLPEGLCADCSRLFDRNDWSWESHEPRDAIHEPYYQILPDSLPVPRLRPQNFYGENYWEIDRDCALCSLLSSKVKWDIENGPDYFTSTKPERLDITQVDEFRWSVRLYNNGFIELWLGYKFYDPNRSFKMGHLVTLVPVTGVGWCFENPSPTSEGPRAPQSANASQDLEQTFQLIRGWLDDCRFHAKCHHKVPGTRKRLPTRLIHVSKAAGALKGITIKAELCQGTALSKDTPYATLSHCWGKTKFLTLTRNNLDHMVRGIPVAQLPQVFQDAMRVTLELGLSYLWIDSLCIVQDSENLEDWKREAPRMGEVYGQADFGIAATGFADGQSGLFGRPRTISQTRSVYCVRIDWELEKILPNLSTVYGGHFAFTHWQSTTNLQPMAAPKTHIDNSPLYKRGWTLQERVLSPRVIHFGPTQIMWECENLVASDTFPANYFPGGHSMERSKLDGVSTAAAWSIRRLPSLSSDEIHLFWRQFVQLFSQGEFTVADDRVPAVAGISQVLGRITGDRYMSGCWLEDIHRNLLWASEVDWSGKVTPIPMHRQAPSWSWLSVDGGVNFRWHHQEVTPFTEVKISSCCREGWSESPAGDDCAGLDQTSVAGLIVEAPLYSIRHRLWRGDIVIQCEPETLYATWPGVPSFFTHMDAKGLEKPKEFEPHRQRLRWATPTHLLPLTWWKLGVEGLLLVEDPMEDNVFIRVGCFERLFDDCFEAKARAVFGGDSCDRDLNEVAKAGLYFLGTKTFSLE